VLLPSEEHRLHFLGVELLELLDQLLFDFAVEGGGQAVALVVELNCLHRRVELESEEASSLSLSSHLESLAQNSLENTLHFHHLHGVQVLLAARLQVLPGFQVQVLQELLFVLQFHLLFLESLVIASMVVVPLLLILEHELKFFGA